MNPALSELGAEIVHMSTVFTLQPQGSEHLPTKYQD
jgi:hypothetical protein